jgi:hypothetical protein
MGSLSPPLLSPRLVLPGTTFQDHFQRHSMAAGLTGFKEITITLPGIIDILDGVRVIIPIKSNNQ